MREAGLQLHERDLQRFFDRTPDLIFAQQGGKIIYTNAAFVRAMRGGDAKSFLGRQVTSIIAMPDRERIAAQLREPDPEITRAPTDVRCLRDDGTQCILEYSAMRAGDPLQPISIITSRDVTHARTLAAELHRADAGFRSLFQDAPIGIAQIDLDGRYQQVNRSFCELTGYSADELRVISYFELVIPEDRALDMAAVQALQEGKRNVKLRKRWRRKDGQVIHVSMHVTVMTDPAGVTNGYLTHAADVSAEVKAQATLRLAEEQLRTIFNSAPIGMGMTALGEGRGYFQRVNQAMCDLLGYSEQEMLSLPLSTFTDPADAATDVNRLQLEHLRVGEQQMVIKRYRSKEGVLIEAERYLSIVGDGAGKPAAVVIQLIDVTVRRSIEKALHESEALHRILVRNLPNVAVLLFDHDLRYKLVDGEQLLAGVGLSAFELVGKTPREVNPPAAAERVEKMYRTALSGEAVRWEHHRDGHVFDVHTSPMRDDSGAIVGGMTLLYDTTEQWRLQQKLADSEARLASLIESTGDAICSLDPEGRVTVFNSKFAADMRRIFHFEVEPGDRLVERLPVEPAAHTADNHARAMKGETVTLEWSDTVGGELQHHLLTCSPILVGAEITGAVLTAKDITARRMMELQTERQKKVFELLQAISAVANESTTSDNAIAHSLALVAEFAGWQLGHAFKVVKGELVSRRLWFEADLARYARFRTDTERMSFRPGDGLAGLVFESKHWAWMGPLEADERFQRREVAALCGLKSAFAFPVLVGDDVATVIEFFSERAEEPTQEIVELMVSVGIQLGRVIERELHASEVRALSLTDELTGLQNRRGFLAFGHQAVRASARLKRTTAVIFADLDGLKKINDTLGHEAGDEAIIGFAKVLRETFREGDILSRFGGDEFVVMMQSPESAGAAAIARLNANLEKRNAANPELPALAASFGFVELNPDGSESLESLVARADALMYETKKARKAARAQQALAPAPTPASPQGKLRLA
jgi:diguanylate cyclase (GGDEF)-like protein/PAS domain S-box-containing protein